MLYKVNSSEIVKSWLDTGQNHQTSLQYDSFGNIVADTDALGRTSKYQYDFLTNTFPISIINPAGHVTYFSYDLGTGNLLWSEKNGT